MQVCMFILFESLILAGDFLKLLFFDEKLMTVNLNITPNPFRRDNPCDNIYFKMTSISIFVLYKILMKASSLQRGLTCFQTNGNGIKLNCVQNIHPKLVSLFWGVYDASAPDTNFSPKIFRSQWQGGWKEQYFLAFNSFSQLFKANHTAS